MNRIEIYKQAVELIMSKSYPVNEMQTLSNVINYLATEIQTHESTEASNDTGPQG